MAKKKNEIVNTKQELKPLYKIIPPGVCPYCNKGPIMIITRDSYPVIVDKDGYSMILGDISTRSYGVCTNCGKALGDFEQHMFQWFPKNHPYKDRSLEETKARPSYNFFGNIHEQIGEKQEWIIPS